MSLADLFRSIESHATNAEVNVASDFRTALRIAQSLSAVETLDTLIAQPNIAEQVFRRILDITDSTPDVRYEHPLDVALMVYSWLLHNRAASLASVAASELLRVPNLWWASKMVASITNPALSDQTIASGSSGRLGPENQGAGDQLVFARLNYPRRVVHGTLTSVTEAGSQRTAPDPRFDGKVISTDKTSRQAGQRRSRLVAA